MVTINPIQSSLDSLLHPARPRHAPQRVLVAANDDACQVLAKALRSDGYDVVQVCGDLRFLTAIARDLGAKNGPDPVDLLIELPMSTGVQVLEQIRAAGWTMPVILMTAFVDTAMREHTAALGALVVHVPLNIDDLRIVVVHILEMKSLINGDRRLIDLVADRVQGQPMDAR